MSPYSPSPSEAASSSHTTPYFAPASILRVTHSPDVMLRTISTEQLNGYSSAATVNNTATGKGNDSDTDPKVSPSTSNGHARKVSAATSTPSTFAISPADLDLGRSAQNDTSPAAAKPQSGDDASGGIEGDSKEDKGDKRAPQRARTGCLTCRRRKVKCDEGRPRCARCKIKLREVRAVPARLNRQARRR